MGERSSSNNHPIESGISPELLAALDAADQVAAQVPAIIYVLDRGMNVVWVANHWECFSGRTIEDTKSHGFQNSLHPDEADSITLLKKSIFESWSKSTLTAAPLSLTYRVRRQNGDFSRVLDRVAASQNELGTIVGFVGVLVEIGETVLPTDSKYAERLQKLSKRESQVATFLSSGLTNRLTAQQMGISVRTVEAHRARLMKKLGIRSIVELVQIPMLQTKSTARKPKR